MSLILRVLLFHGLVSGCAADARWPQAAAAVRAAAAHAFEGYEQHDCQEFLRFLVDGLHNDLNRVVKQPAYAEIKDRMEGESLRALSQRWWDHFKERQDSHISDIFCGKNSKKEPNACCMRLNGFALQDLFCIVVCYVLAFDVTFWIFFFYSGQLVSHCTCRTCKHTSTTFDPFFDLSLPIPSSSSIASRYSKCSIEDCLQKYCTLEELSAKAGYVCAKCKQVTPSSSSSYTYHHTYHAHCDAHVCPNKYCELDRDTVTP